MFICCILNFYVTVAFSKELLAPMNQNLEEIRDILKALLSSKGNSSEVFNHTSQTLVYLVWEGNSQQRSCNYSEEVQSKMFGHKGKSYKRMMCV